LGTLTLMARPRRREVLRLVFIVAASLAIATVIVAVLEGPLGVADGSAVYIVAVVATAFLAGTVGAVLAAFGAFLLHDYLFTAPVGTFTVDDPGEWLELALLLFVGIGYYFPFRDPVGGRWYMWVMGPGLKGAGCAVFLADYFLRNSPKSFLLFAASDGALALLTLAVLLRSRSQ